jgi:hypothetical protein
VCPLESDCSYLFQSDVKLFNRIPNTVRCNDRGYEQVSQEATSNNPPQLAPHLELRATTLQLQTRCSTLSRYLSSKLLDPSTRINNMGVSVSLEPHRLQENPLAAQNFCWWSLVVAEHRCGEATAA